MKALFSVPKDPVVKAEEKKGKRKTSSRAQSLRKPKLSDKDQNRKCGNPPMEIMAS
jgi:hypothetical protein